MRWFGSCLLTLLLLAACQTDSGADPPPDAPTGLAATAGDGQAMFGEYLTQALRGTRPTMVKVGLEASVGRVPARPVRASRTRRQGPIQ